uniref:Uncharacterized protein n=1 Tax=viral metagenome TaxID=1070528 RepID=A0A6M3LVA5_9ZZZZ
MWYSGQTLRHKITNELVRLNPEPSTFAWEIGKNTSFIREDGTKFIGNSNDYTHIEDELERPHCKQPKEGQFVDESAKKYLVGRKTLLKMRRKKLLEWEKEVLFRMENGCVKKPTKTIYGGTIYPRHYGEKANKIVNNPFSDGSVSFIFQKFFLERRKAKPFYKEYSQFSKKWTNGPLIFHHNGFTWMYNPHMSNLKVIKLF